MSKYKNTYIMSNAYSDSTRQMNSQKEQDNATIKFICSKVADGNENNVKKLYGYGTSEMIINTINTWTRCNKDWEIYKNSYNPSNAISPYSIRDVLN